MDANTPRQPGVSDPGEAEPLSPENGWGDGPPSLPAAGESFAVTPPTYVSPRGALALGIALALLVAVAVYALIAIWPAVTAATRGGRIVDTARITLFGVDWRPPAEVALLMLVVCSSALGGALHAAVSFTDYVGNRRLATSWIWWYVLRVHVGTALAVLFYFALRGGLFSATSATDAINPFGIAALAGLVGLFSKQATDKLREVFDTMFRTAPGHGDDHRGDGITNPVPVVGGVEPSRFVAGTAVLDVTVSGEGFTAQSVVRVTRSLGETGPLVQRATRLVDGCLLQVRLDARDVLEEGTVYLTVVNPPPGGGASPPAEIHVDPPAAVSATGPNGAGARPGER